MTVDVGIVGAGGIGRTHAEVLDGLSNARVAAVADLDAERAGALADDVGAEAHDSHEPLLDGVDAVYVTTPPRERVEILRDAAEAGLAILCEKPLAGTVEDGEAIVEVVERTGVPFMMGFCMRFREPFVRLREYLREGDLGEPLHLFSVRHGQGVPEGENWRTDPEQLVGVTVESVSHDLDLLRWLGGDVATARGEAVGSRPSLGEFDDNVSATLRFEGGAIGAVDVGWTSAVGHNRRGIVGTEGTAVVEGPSMWRLDRLRYRGAGAEETVTEFPEETATDMGYRGEAEAFVEVVETGGRAPVGVHDGMAALERSHEILENSGGLHDWR